MAGPYSTRKDIQMAEQHSGRDAPLMLHSCSTGGMPSIAGPYSVKVISMPESSSSGRDAQMAEQPSSRKNAPMTELYNVRDALMAELYSRRVAPIVEL